VLIAGGVGKDQDFSLLAPAVRKHCKRVLTLGEAARDIELALGNAVPCSRMADLDAAIMRASELAESGDLVLLSPACASFDMFSSYEARGDAFRSLVSQTIGAQS
jgi:UDP-N-acetylmuramoylalanine--D-glutamate ligase